VQVLSALQEARDAQHRAWAWCETGEAGVATSPLLCLFSDMYRAAFLMRVVMIFDVFVEEFLKQI